MTNCLNKKHDNNAAEEEIESVSSDLAADSKQQPGRPQWHSMHSETYPCMLMTRHDRYISYNYSFERKLAFENDKSRSIFLELKRA